MRISKEDAQKYADTIGFGAYKDTGQYINLKGKKIWYRGGDPTGNYPGIGRADYAWFTQIHCFVRVKKNKNGYCMESLLKNQIWSVQNLDGDLQGSTEGECGDNKQKLIDFLKCNTCYGSEENIFKAIRREFKLSTMEERLKNIFINGKNKLKEDAEIKSKQIIFTGAPGTGKTYTAKKMTKIFCVMNDQKLNFEEAKKIVEIIDLIEDKYSKDNFETAINEWDKENPKNKDEFVNKKRIQECHEALKKRIQFVQFHPSYDYSDFVEGLRPVVVESQSSDFSMKYSEIDTIKETCNEKGTFEGDIRSKSVGNPTFVRLDGIFKEFCRKAAEENNKDNKYFFIIDEINRADLSKVFGELMYCLEEDYRGKKNRVQTQYRNLTTYKLNGKFAKQLDEDCFADGFYIPENVYIIGTMNDIDRSVEAFDFALRRRFKWIPVEAEDEMGALDIMLNNVENVDELKKRIENLNYEIAKDNKDTYGKKLGLTKAYHIGHAYFKDFDGKNYDEIWDSRINPLLESYCVGQDCTDFINECRKYFLNGKERIENANDKN